MNQEKAQFIKWVGISLSLLGGSVLWASSPSLMVGQPLVGYFHHHGMHKTIRFQHFLWTPFQKKIWAHRAKNFKPTLLSNTFPWHKIDLGMNGVPVLDQGAYGSCVTFANTAAVDAIMGEGDYVSQWCHLALGSYFQAHSKNYGSGWNGSYGPIILNQMLNFGVVPKSKEQQVRCGGALSYDDAGHTEASMSLEDFNAVSVPIQTRFDWVPLLSTQEALSWNIDLNVTLQKIKQALWLGDRVTIGFLVDLNEEALGAVGQYRVKHDTWVLSKHILDDLVHGIVNAGHELIVIGFDDHAMIQDPDGYWHQGLLLLRNSWGEEAGDGGNFYMSYDYFRLFVVEAQRIINVKSPFLMAQES